jgi:flagellar hook assembly protein FlgD
VYPNPSRGEARIDLRSVGETGSQYGRLTVHDAAGRQVRTLYQGNVDVNGHGVSWDGRDSRGVEVTAGIYWVRFEGEGQARAVAQVTLVR